MTAPTRQPNPDRTPGEFRKRLGVYLFGVAIGLVLLGFLQLARIQARRSQAPVGVSQPTPATGNVPAH